MNSYELQRVRFAKGALHHADNCIIPAQPERSYGWQIRNGIITGIKRNCRDMLMIPGSFGGAKGIAYWSPDVEDKLGDEKARSYLATRADAGRSVPAVVAFVYLDLQQAHAYLPIDELLDISQQITATGDKWRDATGFWHL